MNDTTGSNLQPAASSTPVPVPAPEPSVGSLEAEIEACRLSFEQHARAAKARALERSRHWPPLIVGAVAVVGLALYANKVVQRRRHPLRHAYQELSSSLRDRYAPPPPRESALSMATRTVGLLAAATRMWPQVSRLWTSLRREPPHRRY